MYVTCPFMKHHKSSFLEHQESKKGPQQPLVKPQVRLLWADLRNYCFVPLSLSRALFASPAFPQSPSFTYQLLDCTGKESPYLQLQLRCATSSLQRCPLWLPGLQRSERCFKFAQIHYYYYFYPSQYGRRLLAKTIWPGKVTLWVCSLLAALKELRAPTVTGREVSQSPLWPTGCAYGKASSLFLQGTSPLGGCEPHSALPFDTKYTCMKTWT